MITPNPKAHMSPKDLTRLLASEAQVIPGFSLNDRNFHASLAANREAFAQISNIHHAIKSYYLGQGHSLEQWQAVSSDLKKFNQVWRQSLRLPLDDAPPPLQWRFVLPLHSSIQLSN
ncbi:MAG: hypothetical protein Q8L15_05675 [Methylobacter sp.]|nr:hypothetical protein [Methylobacter sp.]